MSWINNIVTRYRLRNTDYNNSVCMSRANINRMMVGFDTIFGEYIMNFTDEIASLQLYPFRIKNYVTSEHNYLETTRGVNIGVRAYEISWYANYQTLGEFFVSPKNNNFTDYKGYTTLKAYLPFFGFVDIDINECLGKYLQFRLLTDFTTGKGLYIIGVSDESITHPEAPYVYDDEDDSVRVISTFECDIGIEIPLGSSNIGDIKRNMLLGAIKTVASAGFSAYTNALPPTSSVTTVEDTSIASARGDYKGAKIKPMSMTQHTSTSTTVHNRPINKSKPYEEVLSGSIDVLNRSYPNSNTDRVNDSMLLFQTSKNIHLVFYRPKILPKPDGFNHLYGEPLGEVKSLNELSGYTEVSRIHFEAQHFGTVTSTEYAMIEQAFSDGVILP